MQTETVSRASASQSLGEILRRRTTGLLLAASLLLSCPLLLVNALSHQYPLGAAGLFTQMAQQIAAADFGLPLQSPYYGPGSIPFAYPPLGLYLLAVLIRVTGKYLFFLRVLPPLWSLLSLVPLFFLTRQFSRSSWAAAAALLLLAASPTIYLSHAQAAGIVRAPALLLALASLFFFTRQLDRPSTRDLVISGVLFGLTGLTHLMYGLFCFLWICWWAAFHERPLRRLKDALLAGLVALVTALPWLVIVLRRYGFTVFRYALGTHGSDTGPVFTLGWLPFFRSLWLHLEPVTSDPVLAVLALLGVLGLLLRRRYTLPGFALLVTLFFPGDGTFMVVVACLLAGCGVAALIDWAHALGLGSLKEAGAALVLAALLGYAWWSGFQVIARIDPLLSASSYALAPQARARTAPDGVYLALLRKQEAEWLPFLLQRRPLVSQWGSEWLGTYGAQTALSLRFGACRQAQDLACVESTIADTGQQPQLLLTDVTDRKLNNQLDISPWRKVYANDRYIMWLRSGN